MPLPALALSLLLAAPPAARPAAPPPAAPAHRQADPWSAVRFLVGTWRVEAAGKPGEATGGGFIFSIDLDGKVAVRRSRSEFAPLPGETEGAVHEDLMVLYPKGNGLQAMFWDDQGKVVRCAVRNEAGTLIFESEPGAAGPRFRLVHARRGADLVEMSLSVAPRGKGFQPPVTGLARRIGDP